LEITESWLVDNVQGNPSSLRSTIKCFRFALGFSIANRNSGIVKTLAPPWALVMHELFWASGHDIIKSIVQFHCINVNVSSACCQ